MKIYQGQVTKWVKQANFKGENAMGEIVWPQGADVSQLQPTASVWDAEFETASF